MRWFAGLGLQKYTRWGAGHAAVLENAPKADAIAMNPEAHVLESISPQIRAVVCISLASETGVIQPGELVRQLRAKGPVWVHRDGASCGTYCAEHWELDVDSFASHSNLVVY